MMNNGARRVPHVPIFFVARGELIMNAPGLRLEAYVGLFAISC
jgi:hypothetical protein